MCGVGVLFGGWATTFGGTTPISLRAVPGEKVLVGVEMGTEGAPVMPIFLQHVRDIGVVVAAVPESE